MASIFSARGGYESGQAFAGGLRPASVTGSAVVAVGGIAPPLIPARRRVEEGVAAGEQVPVLETAAR